MLAKIHDQYMKNWRYKNRDPSMGSGAYRNHDQSNESTATKIMINVWIFVHTKIMAELLKVLLKKIATEVC